ncbi:MAG TPA: hypothetical protein VFK26_03565, partial [Gemmatimonadaceae bacterium]|nr:hypothetical protein [Gemmatimonadaceae bacterium]
MKIIAGLVAGSVLISGVVSAQTPARLTASPARPQPGAIIRLTLTAPAKHADSVVSVRGALAEEPLHFMRATDGTWHAIGGVPVDAEGSLVANAVIHRASGGTEIARVRFTLPPIPPPVAQPLAVDSSFTKPMSQATIDRIARENQRARQVGRDAHDHPPMWTEAFLKPRESVI